MTPLKTGDHIYLIDGSGYIFRAYHALPALTRASDGAPIGAVHGFCQMIWKLMQDQNDAEKPSHMAVIFDAARKNFRNDIYPEYKANRPPAPEDLIPQFPLIKDATKAFNLPCVEQEGYEADDLIATYAVQAAALGATVTIISSDKDLMQLVAPGIEMLDTMKNNRHIGPEQVMEKFGVGPDKVIDVQSLAGDSTDNVPGVPGIGIKTAAQLINEYGDLDTLLDQADGIKQKKRRENLIEFAEQARISRDLVTLKQDVPVETDLNELRLHDPVAETLLAFMQEMEFTKLTQRVAASLGAEAPAAKKSKTSTATPQNTGDATPESLAATRLAEQAAIPVDRTSYKMVTRLEDLQDWINKATNQGYFAFDTETTGLDAMQAELVGISMATQPNEACYVPLAHTANDGLSLDLEDTSDIEQIPMRDALDVLKPLLEDEGILKIGQNLKYDMQIMRRYDIHLKSIDDTMLISYAVDTGRGRHGMDALAERHLNHICIPTKDLLGTGKKQITFDKVPVDKATEYAAEDADITLRLWNVLKPRLAAEKQTTVYEILDRPLSPVLADMEAHGVKVDRQVLSRLSGNFAQRIEAIEAEIHDIAGEPFNVGSPKQMGEILFGKMGLPGGKKTKTGAYSTGINVLDDLAANEDLPEDARKLVQTIQEWRQLSKLKSTYTDTLPNFIHPETGRIHTSYMMTGTSTGRLASSDPNLQNIPIRTKEGREIRTAFIAEKGNKLISADYSQIELRILAHIADIEALKKAFENNLDIHAMTASEMFDTPIEGMDPMVRRRAKAINFGIIYGISAFGLANQLGISRSEAGDYIKTYFKRFPGIRAYMEETKQQAREDGYVQTIFGRTMYYPQMASGNKQQMALFERAAINAPIQGSAADIIRRAMIRMPGALEKAGLKSTRMLLQVHDELIFEAPEDDVEKTIKTASDIMENSCDPVLQLSVPLKVEAQAADNWDEAH